MVFHSSYVQICLFTISRHIFIFRPTNHKILKTIVLLGIAFAISVGIIAAVFVVGGMYQQELFEEYIEDTQNPPRAEVNPNLPAFDILP